jgi:hypothetical protein
MIDNLYELIGGRRTVWLRPRLSIEEFWKMRASGTFLTLLL